MMCRSLLTFNEFCNNVKQCTNKCATGKLPAFMQRSYNSFTTDKIILNLVNDNSHYQEVISQTKVKLILQEKRVLSVNNVQIIEEMLLIVFPLYLVTKQILCIRRYCFSAYFGKFLKL